MLGYACWQANNLHLHDRYVLAQAKKFLYLAHRNK